MNKPRRTIQATDGRKSAASVTTGNPPPASSTNFESVSDTQTDHAAKQVANFYKGGMTRAFFSKLKFSAAKKGEKKDGKGEEKTHDEYDV